MTTGVQAENSPATPWAGPAVVAPDDRKRMTGPATDHVELVMIPLAASVKTNKTRSKNLTQDDETEANLR